jgi:adhesin transport system outer membrane protein
MFKKSKLCVAVIVAITGISLSQAQDEPQQLPVESSGAQVQSQQAPAIVSSLKEAITQGVLYSPRVNADWYNFAASGEAQQAARGGYFPSADLYAEAGREDRKTPLFDLGEYGRDATEFSITQMLFDGFATRDEVAMLGYDKLSNYYIFKRSSEEVALEVAVAYLETVKYQQLVKYAEDNLKVHRQIHDQISERTGGGVSEGVDLDQAVARVGLAETNLVTETTNLHDVEVRFQRLIGSLPGDKLEVPAVPAGQIPALRGAALEVAYQNSPVINAAIENLRASQEALNLTNAPFMPRFDLRYRNDVEHDTDGINGKFEEEAIEVVMKYNLFRGGADSARKREYYNLYYAAIEERKQACLNVRQEISNDFNNIAALQQQVVLTDVSMRAQDKTRLAYRDQFDRGKRSLLDLLDSQNEYFDSQRSHMTAVVDLVAAEASTLANMGQLLASLEVDGINADKVAAMDLDLARDPNDENSHALCPGEPATAVPPEPLPADEPKIVLELNVQFENNSAVVTSAYDSEIAVAAATMKDNPKVNAVVEAHTDSVGTDKYNQWLSDRRAESVFTLLVDKYGVNPAQLTAVGRGETMPVASNSTAEGRAQNRRVELIMDDPRYRQ